MGATCDISGREKFDSFLRQLLVGGAEEGPPPAAVGKLECPFPPEGLVYDYLFEQKGRGKWVPWLDTIKEQSIDPAIKKLSDIIVPTMDTARLE